MKVVGALGLAVAAVSCAASLIVIAAPLPPPWIAGGRVAVTGVALCLLGAPQLRAAWRAVAASGPVLLGRLGLAGALLAVHFGAWVASLSETSVLRSTAIVASQPLFAGLIGRIIGDRAPPRLYWGAAVAVAGSVVLTGADAGSQDAASGSTLGDVLALVGAVAAAGYLVVGRSVRAELPLRPYLGAVHLVAAVLLLATAMVWPAEGLREATVADWAAVVTMGLIPGVVGHGLLNWAVRRLEVHVVSLVILLEPLGATAIAMAALGHRVTGPEVLGAVILLAGVGIGLPRPRRQPV